MSLRPAVLYAFHASGCSVCEETMPKVRVWASARVAKVAFVEVNVSWNGWRPDGMTKVKATPTFAVLKGPEMLATQEGAFADEDEFDAFLGKALP